MVVLFPKSMFKEVHMLSGIKSSLGAIRRKLEDSILYARHKLSKTTYSEYYAQRMDRIIKRDPNWGLNTNKEFQLEFLINKGLKESDSFLDYGCGAINAGIFFIKYLDPEKYYGVDVSQAAIDEGLRRVSKFELEIKKPIVKLIKPGDLTSLNSKKFNFIWANSVLTHMNPQDIENLFKSLKDVMDENSVFYATFTRHEAIKHYDLKDWRYPIYEMEKMAEKCGYKFEVIKDWNHPQDKTGLDTLGAFKLAH